MPSSYDKLYPVNVFLSTILIVAIVFGFLMFFGDGENKEGIFTYMTTLVFISGIAYSLPTFVIYYLMFLYIIRMNLATRTIKYYLLLTTIILLPVPFILMKMSLLSIFPILGLVAAIIMTFIVPLKRPVA